MKVSGTAIAKEMLGEVRRRVQARRRPPRLIAVACAPRFATLSYLRLKKEKAASVGIPLSVVTLPEDITTTDAVASVAALSRYADGIVVQLPLPPSLILKEVLACIPPSHDVDVLNPQGNHRICAPVAGACKEILTHCGINPKGMRAIVVGKGRLVGGPVAAWLEDAGAVVTVLERGDDIACHTKSADLVVLGAGAPHMLTPPMVREGVVVLDAGTSEIGGELQGDAHPSVAKKAAVFTPVPGGIGPVTVAKLFENLLVLAEANQ